MDNAAERKPLVIICLDDPMAQEVLAALPKNTYDIRLCQATRGRYKEADALEALTIFERHVGGAGFIIADENTASGISGASLTSKANKKGWHTVLRSGSYKNSLELLADLYLSGERNGENNVNSIVQFITARTDEHGHVTDKNTLPELLPWEMALTEYENSLKQSRDNATGTIPQDKKNKAISIIRLLLQEVKQGKYPKVKEFMGHPVKARRVAAHVLEDIFNHIDGKAGKPKMLAPDEIDHLVELSRPPCEAEELRKEFEENPYPFYARSYAEVRKREDNNDEPPGAADEYLARIKQALPDFEMSDAEEAGAIWLKREILRTKERQKHKKTGRGHADPD